MWVSPFPSIRAVPISRHGGDPHVRPYVRKVVLELLEADLAAWEDKLRNEARSESGGLVPVHGEGSKLMKDNEE